METIQQYLPILLGVVGGLLQFLVRQFKGMPEWAFYAIAVVLLGGTYLLVTELSPSWRLEVVRFIAWLVPNLLTTLGGTFLVSNGAKAAAKLGAPADSVFVPITNSR